MPLWPAYYKSRSNGLVTSAGEGVRLFYEDHQLDNPPRDWTGDLHDKHCFMKNLRNMCWIDYIMLELEPSMMNTSISYSKLVVFRKKRISERIVAFTNLRSQRRKLSTQHRWDHRILREDALALEKSFWRLMERWTTAWRWTQKPWRSDSYQEDLGSPELRPSPRGYCRPEVSIRTIFYFNSIIVPVSTNAFPADTSILTCLISVSWCQVRVSGKLMAAM